MGMNFDKNIRESMENFELPYDSSAWNELSKRLDQTMPVTPKSSMKWWPAAAVILLATITAAYFMNSSVTEKTVSKNNPSSETTVPQSSAVSPTETTEIKEKINSEITEKTAETVKTAEQKTPEQTKTSIPEDLVYNKHDEKPVEIKSDSKYPNYVIPSISNICLGHAISISNTNAAELILVYPNTKKVVITPHDDYHFGATMAGDYELGYMRDGTFISKEKFVVMSGAKADMTISESTIENGIPTVHLSAENATGYSWEIDKHQNRSTKEADVHFFYKGSYDVKLTTTSTNGCTSSDKEKIVITEDYDLLAPNAFSPADDIAKNKTWIPVALKTRNVKFTLTIVDPINGGIIYQTNDASQPWDGTDMRTGNLVPENSNSIWTVKLFNPEPGERADYKGVIIRL